MKKLLKIFSNYCIFIKSVLKYLRINVLVCLSVHINREVNTLPNIKSAKKRVKVTSAKSLQNQMFKTNLKSTLKKFEQAVAAGDKAAAEVCYKAAVSKLLLQGREPSRQSPGPAEESPGWVGPGQVSSTNKVRARVTVSGRGGM